MMWPREGEVETLRVWFESGDNVDGGSIREVGGSIKNQTQFYLQWVRKALRFWGFGQTRGVTILVVGEEGEGERKSIERSSDGDRHMWEFRSRVKSWRGFKLGMRS